MQSIECKIRERAHDVDEKGNLGLGHISDLCKMEVEARNLAAPETWVVDGRGTVKTGRLVTIAEPRYGLDPDGGAMIGRSPRAVT